MAQTLEQQIRKVIKQYYDEDLSTFRHDVSYREGTRNFVTDVAKAIRGELEYVSDLPNPIAKYLKFDNIDRTIGKCIKKLRIKRGVTQEQLAKTAGFDKEFFDTLEKGHLVPTADLYLKVYGLLKPTKEEKKEFADAIAHDAARESIIRDVIELYYGWNLWAFRPGVGYEKAIEPFVKSLAALARNLSRG